MSRYNEIMERIKVTDEMRERIISKIAERKGKRHMNTMVWVSAAAACIVAVVGAVAVLNRPDISQTPPAPPASTQQENTPSATPEETQQENTPSATPEEEQDTREDPEIKVTEEEFMEKYSAVVCTPDEMPDGIEILEYRIDTGTDRGFIAFNKDGILWNAYVKPDNIYPEAYRNYVDEDMEEIVPSLGGQVTTVCGAGPELHYYRIKYSEDNVWYRIYAKWEIEGWQLVLMTFTEEPVHSLPVEIFRDAG